MMDEQLWQHISIAPKVMVGKLVIRGTRIPVELIVRMLAQGIPESDILREYPRLQPDDIRAALAYAARVACACGQPLRCRDWGGGEGHL